MDGTAKTIPMNPLPDPTGEPHTRTGSRVRQLVEDVEADLTDVETLLVRAREHLGRLEAEARGINGLSAACRGWGQQLDKLVRDLDEERDQVERTMLGSNRTIAAHVDGELRDRIRLARQG
ncbi:MAG: hypothetical protein R3324_17430 [Halobacteriales archaeon]|nr:hypothetical protein [Halobacteriales archaeon]